jgi:hypothetical protein
MTDQNLFGDQAKTKRNPANAAPVQRLIAIWMEIFERKYGERPIVAASAGATLKRLLAAGNSEALVERRLRAFMELDDPYLQAHGYAIRLLAERWNGFAAAKAPAPAGNGAQGADQTSDYLRSLKNR